MKNTIYNVNSDNSCTMNISTLSMKDRTDKTKDSLSIANLQLGEANYQPSARRSQLSIIHCQLSILTALLIVFCLFFGGKTWGQTIVVNGTGTNQYVPMYNYYNDYGHRSEYIIPASYFSSAGITNGARLNSITLYRSATGSWTAKDLTIKLTNTSTSYYSNTSFLGLNGTTVYTSSSYSGGSSSSYTFNFSSPFTYTGGSLVVHIYAANGGTCSSSSTASTWYGISSTSNYQGCYAYGSSSANATTGTRVNFLPQTAFTYSTVSSHTLAGTIQCGQTVSGTLGTSGTWGTGSSPYNMNSSWGVGGEAVYAFTPQMTGTHTITWGTTSGDPDFWVLSDNNPQTAIYATGSGNTSAELSAGHTYYLVADNYSSSSSAGYEITVTCPEPPVTVEVGSSQSTSTSIPTSSFYNYSLSQQIYKASEIGCTGTISQISYYHNSTAVTRNVVIYMKMTSNNTLSSYDSSPGTQVFSGNVTFVAGGWTTITLNTPFNYSNICQNLMITMDDNTGSYSSSYSFATYNTGENRALYGNSDSNNYSPTSSNSLSTSTYNNYIKLYMTSPTTYKILTLSYDSTMGSVSVNPSGTTCTSTRAYAAGTTVTLTASANTGHSFVNWTVDGTTVTNNPTTITMNDHHTVVANFTETPVSIPYTETFESSAWKFVNGSRTNKWYRGNAGVRSGSYGLFVSNDGSNATYTVNSASAVWTYKTFTFDETTNYAISFDWKAYGESSYDYIRVGLVPASTTLVDGESFSAPTGWIDLNNSTYLNQKSDWQHKTTIINVTAGDYKLAFCWRNDGSSGTPPSACIDNVELKKAVTVALSAGSGGSASGGGTFAPNQRCTVTATPNSNYCFVNWTEGGTEVSTTPTYTFDVTANRTLVANFVSLNASSIAVSGNTTINCGNTTTLSASGMNGFVYNWYSDASCTNLVATGSSFTTPALNDNATYYVKAVKSTTREQVSTFSYTGSSQSYSVPSGANSVKMEVWGAQGGGRQQDANPNGGVGGKGGYSVGTMPVSGGEALYVYVGQQGFESSAFAQGGWNGGGSNYGSSDSEPSSGGGGATDIRITGNTIYYRVIVAGGGGGGGEDTGDLGGYGGGTSGGAGNQYSYPGTQTSAGNGGVFGTGASAGNDGGAGGGGWYGGGTNGGSQSTPSSGSGTDCGGGSGGSGYVWTSSTASSAPSGYGVSTAYYFTDAQTIAGNASMPNPDGGTMTGREGNGYARITAIISEECETDAKAVNVSVICNFTVSVSANPAGSGNINHTGGSWSGNTGSYTPGSTATLTANASTGYTFSNWTENGSQVSTNTTYTISNIAANHTLVANFTPNPYTISVSANPTEGGTVSGGGTYNYGASCTVTASTNTGYTFNGWYEGNTQVSSNSSYTFTVSGARTLVAKYTLNTYTVTAAKETGINTAYVKEGTTFSGTSTTATVSHGGSATFKATVSPGYTFDGWYYNSTRQSTSLIYTRSNITGAITITAKAKQNTVTITGAPAYACTGTVSTLTATQSGFTSPRYTWSVTGGNSSTAGLSSSSNVATVSPTAEGTYTYQCSVTENGSGTPAVASVTIVVRQGATITFPVSSPYSACENVNITPTIEDATCSDVSWAWSGDYSASGTGTTVDQYTVSAPGTYSYTFTVNRSPIKQYDMITRNGIAAIVVVVPTYTTDGIAVPIGTGGIGTNESAGNVAYNAIPNLQEAIRVNGGTTYDSGNRTGFKIHAGAESGVCQSTASVEVTIVDKVTPTFTDPGPICSGSVFTLPSSSTNNSALTGTAISGSWSPAVNSTATTTYTFTPNANQCSNTATMLVEVKNKVTPTFTNPGPICSGSALTLPSSSNNSSALTGTAISGSWSPAVNSTATTTYTFTPNANQCSNTATMLVEVKNKVTPTFTNPGPICSGTAFTLPSSSNNNSTLTGTAISGSWSPAVNNTATTTYTFTPNANQCSNSNTILVIVNDRPSVSPITAPDAICVGEPLDLTTPTVTPNGSSITAEGWEISSSQNGAYTPFTNSNLQQNQDGYYIRYTATNACGSSSNTGVQITVNAPSISITSTYDYVWRGGTSNWNIASNWYEYNNGTYTVASALPTEAKNYYIALGGTGTCLNDVQQVYMNADATVNTIDIAPGAEVHIQENVTLQLAGSIINNGTFVADNSSTIELNGAADQTLTSAMEFGNVTFAQTANNKKIIAPHGITVHGLATFTRGVVVGDMTFVSGATTSGANLASHVDGRVTKFGNGAFTFPTGSNGVLGTMEATITNNSRAGINLRFNNTSAYGHGYTTEAPDNYPRWWNINDMCSNDDANRFEHVSNFEFWQLDGISGGASLSGITLKVDADVATAHFHDGATANGINANINAAAHYDCWKNIGGTANVENEGKTITVTGISSINYTRSGAFDGIVTIGSKTEAIVLPIELTSFTTTCDGKSALVEWTTATERNNDYFVLERSDDAINFTEVARVAGAGNSIDPIDYAYTDYGIHGGDNYYRLVQVDYDGTRSVSDIVVVNCIETAAGEPDVQAYPNPFDGELTLELDNFDNRPARIDVYDMLGKLIYTDKVASPQNYYETVLNLSNLPPATYTVRVSTADFVINRKVVKQ